MQNSILTNSFSYEYVSILCKYLQNSHLKYSFSYEYGLGIWEDVWLGEHQPHIFCI
jgi:hypothetical protein